MINLNRLWKSFKNDKKSNRFIKEIKMQDINNLNEYVILDVRSRREFREKHINNAINIPLSEIKKNVESVIKNKEKKILVYCQSGVRSRKAIEIMENLGYKELYNLKGGLENI